MFEKLTVTLELKYIKISQLHEISSIRYGAGARDSPKTTSLREYQNGYRGKL